MAQDGDKSWLARKAAAAMESVTSAWRGLQDRYVQWRHGRHTDNRRKMLAQLEALPGGAELLKTARDAGVKIFVVAPHRIDGARGRFSRSATRAVIRIASNGDIDLMTSTLWHELRHAEQHIARGDLKGGGTKLIGTRRQHTYALMHEADAFTQQFLLALRQDKAGKPEYLKKMLARGGAASEAARGFLKKKPYASFENDAQFAREFFTHIMLRGLPGYNAKYLESYYKTFRETENLEEFRMKLKGKTAMALPDASERLTAVYGADYMAKLPLPGIAAAFLKAQPKDVYDALKLVEETTAKAPQMTQREYSAARRDILKRTKTLSKAFRKASLKPAADVQEKLRTAARAPHPASGA